MYERIVIIIFDDLRSCVGDELFRGPSPLDPGRSRMPTKRQKGGTPMAENLYPIRPSIPEGVWLDEPYEPLVGCWLLEEESESMYYDLEGDDALDEEEVI